MKCEAPILKPYIILYILNLHFLSVYLSKYLFEISGEWKQFLYIFPFKRDFTLEKLSLYNDFTIGWNPSNLSWWDTWIEKRGYYLSYMKGNYWLYLSRVSKNSFLCCMTMWLMAVLLAWSNIVLHRGHHISVLPATRRLQTRPSSYFNYLENKQYQII